ncbi:MAG: hypothetical protein V7K61_10225 [Nostoc sp.]
MSDLSGLKSLLQTLNLFMPKYLLLRLTGKGKEKTFNPSLFPKPDSESKCTKREVTLMIYSEFKSKVPQIKVLKPILDFVLGFIFVVGLIKNCCNKMVV